jgi:ABC transport system ATP-binding/permease protein
MAILELKELTLALGGPPILQDINLRVEKGERICLLGRNGEGKTTLLRLLSGELKPDTGEVLRTKGTRIGFLPQEVPMDLEGTVAHVVAAGLTRYRPGESEWESNHLVEQTLTRAGLDGGAQFATLSTGNKRRTLLARALVIEPDILLLDEPTNHLDIDAIDWLEGELQRFTGVLFFVTHDRAFLRRLAQRILELDRGSIRDWTCNFETFLVRREEFLRTQQAQWANFDRKLAEEEVWIRKGVRDRRTRNEGRVRDLLKMRQERRNRRQQQGDAKMRLQDVEKSGRLVLRTRNLGYAWGDLPMVDNLDTMIMRGDKIGILGPNGSGKTTLLRLLLGELQPSTGKVLTGTRLQVAYFDQQRAQLDETKTVLENISEGNDVVFFNGQSMHIVTYLQNFLFTPDRARSPISQLSGGERNRLLLARLFTQPANLLVLDEPTNDLDLETLELLEELLLEFAGTLLVVSHDREFLDNVTTSTLALEGEGRVVETVGGYSDWARVSKAAKAAKQAAGKPPRVAKGKPKTTGPRKLTWKEGKELEELPPRIEELEGQQAGLHEEMSNPRLYQEAPEKAKEIRERLASLEEELATCYARWEELDSIG